jgi:hypothetical protein
MKDHWVKAGMVSSLGIEMSLAVGLFTWGGSELDARFETELAFALVGFVLGLITAVFSMVRTLRRIAALTPKVKFERRNLTSVDPFDTRAFHLPETRMGGDDVSKQDESPNQEGKSRPDNEKQ